MKIILREAPIYGDTRFLSARNMRNLRTLSAYLKTLPVNAVQFDMAQFSIQDDSSPCGTIACALGHAPAAGIGENKQGGWTRYSMDHFGLWVLDGAWSWFFNSLWADRDNTPHGAAARIDWYLKYRDIPRNFTDQMHGLAPLTYEVIHDPL